MGEERTPKFDQDAGAQAVVIGRIVHYTPNPGETFGGYERPAIIVQVWPEEHGKVSLLVFLDGTNDQAYRGAPDNSPTFWVPSVLYSVYKEPRSWHWPKD